MKCVFGLILVCCTAIPGFGSIVFPPFTTDDSITTQVTLATFDAFGNTMGPMIITDNFGNFCIWDTASGACSSAGNFTISFTPLTDRTFPPAAPAGVWTLHNDGDVEIDSITINTLAGNVALDRCMSGPGTFNDDFNNTLFADCNFEGTLGSNFGWTANNFPSDFGVSATVQYSNLLYTGALPSSAVEDLWGAARFTFTSFDPGDDFTWRMDTDLLQGVPEPATLVLVGGALVVLGVLKRRKRG